MKDVNKAGLYTILGAILGSVVSGGITYVIQNKEYDENNRNNLEVLTEYKEENEMLKEKVTSLENEIMELTEDNENLRSNQIEVSEEKNEIDDTKKEDKGFDDLIYKSNDFTYSTDIKVNGNIYNGYIVYNRGAYALLNLDSKYSKLSFDFGALDDACDINQIGNICIILDGVEKYVCKVKGGELLKSFEVDIRDMSQLKMELRCENGSMWADGFGIVNIIIE